MCEYMSSVYSLRDYAMDHVEDLTLKIKADYLDNFMEQYYRGLRLAYADMYNLINSLLVSHEASTSNTQSSTIDCDH